MLLVSIFIIKAFFSCCQVYSNEDFNKKPASPENEFNVENISSKDVQKKAIETKYRFESENNCLNCPDEKVIRGKDSKLMQYSSSKNNLFKNQSFLNNNITTRSETKCRHLNKRIPRRTNDKFDVEIEQYPYLVTIKDSEDQDDECSHCTGSIITPYHVITMAWCFRKILQGSLDIKVIKGFKPKRYYIRSSTTFCNENGTRLRVKRIYFNPKKKLLVRTAVALVRLVHPTESKIATMPPFMRLHDYDRTLYKAYSTSSICKWVSWLILLKKASAISSRRIPIVEPHLKSLSLDLIPLSKCKELIGWSKGERMLCCMYFKNEDMVPCLESVGGAYICEGVQHGLSVGTLACNNSDEATPVYFTLIAYEMFWISSLVHSLRMEISASQSLLCPPLCLMLMVIIFHCVMISLCYMM